MAFEKVGYVCSVLIFVNISIQGESVKIIRGQYDIFSRPVCSSKHTSEDCCKRFDAECLNTSCTWCICQGSKTTYIPYLDKKYGKCMKNMEIVPDTGKPAHFFRVRGQINSRWCVSSSIQEPTSTKLEICNKRDLSTIWIWTNDNQLINIATLHCVTINQSEKSIVMKPCSLQQRNQKFTCSIGQERLLTFGGKAVAFTPFHLAFTWSYQLKLSTNRKGLIYVKNKSKELWNFPKTTKDVLCKKSDYKGCYRFVDGSFLQTINKSSCDDKNSCFTKPISAPIFAENTKCSINWNTSKYLESYRTWKNVKKNKNDYFTIESEDGDNKMRIKIEPEAFEKWSGSILRLAVNCKSEEKSEEHCVLMKFETTKTTPTIPNILTSEQLTSSTRGSSTSPTIILPQAGESSESSSNNTVAIAVSVVILVLIILLILGFLMYKRRQKRTAEQRTNTRETQNHEAQRPNINVYTEPSPMYETVNRNERSNKNNNNTNDYECVDDEEPENEYSYARADDVARTIPRQPLCNNQSSYARNDQAECVAGLSSPLTPSTPIYNTLEESKMDEEQTTQPKTNEKETQPEYAILEDTNNKDDGKNQLEYFEDLAPSGQSSAPSGTSSEDVVNC